MSEAAARPKHSLLKGVLLVIGALVLAVVFYFAFLSAWIIGAFHPTPPIARDMSPTIMIAREQFRDRVRAAFPVGSSETEMLEALRRQGFTRQEADFGGDRGRVPYMGYAAPRGFCGVTYSVYWEAERGRLTEVRGSYGVTCL